MRGKCSSSLAVALLDRPRRRPRPRPPHLLLCRCVLSPSLLPIPTHKVPLVLPHRGSFAESDVPVAGWLFNAPQHIRRLPRTRVSQAIAVDHPFKLRGSRNIILDTIKRGEDDHFAKESKHPMTVILRLYEAFGGHGVVDISTGLDVASVSICDASPFLSQPGHLLHR